MKKEDVILQESAKMEEKITRGLWYLNGNKIILTDKKFNLYKTIKVKK